MSCAGPGPPGGVQGEGWTLQLDQLVSLAELRRHKRAFMKLATKVGVPLNLGRAWAESGPVRSWPLEWGTFEPGQNLGWILA